MLGCLVLKTAIEKNIQSKCSLRDTILLPPIYSRRTRQAEATGQDVYTYTSIPSRVRVQVVQLLETGLGPAGVLTKVGTRRINPCYEEIVRAMRKELGVHKLTVKKYANFQTELFVWLRSGGN